tara:strand:+ start:147 stop:650 length:504 start_codon:yes stop_codon:yes gene_type:complete
MNEIPKLFKSQIYKDKRGILGEVYRKNKKNFNFIIQTVSKKNVFRGFHFQKKFQQSKYIYLLKGEINDYAINLKKRSKNFGKIFNFKLKPGYSVFIPKGYGHGYYTYKKENIVLYIMDNFHKKEYEDGINIFDKKFKFIFKQRKFIISDKDKNWQSFEEFCSNIKGL